MHLRLALPLAISLVGCATTSTGSGTMGQLRDRGGVCTSVSPNMLNKITSCAIAGQPGTLDDDGKTPYLVTTVTGGANAPSANTENWQLEVFRGQELIDKRRMSKHLVPELTCMSGICTSWSISADRVPFTWAPGTYSFRYTLAFDTSVVATNTLVIR